MNTLTQPAVSTTDPLPPPEVTPYFRRCAEFDEAVALEEARRGVPPESRAA